MNFINGNFAMPEDLALGQARLGINPDPHARVHRRPPPAKGKTRRKKEKTLCFWKRAMRRLARAYAGL